jgi:hypothetical protein
VDASHNAIHSNSDFGPLGRSALAWMFPRANNKLVNKANEAFGPAMPSKTLPIGFWEAIYNRCHFCTACTGCKGLEGCNAARNRDLVRLVTVRLPHASAKVPLNLLPFLFRMALLEPIRPLFWTQVGPKV